jgi:hypothetical protein
VGYVGPRPTGGPREWRKAERQMQQSCGKAWGKNIHKDRI